MADRDVTIDDTVVGTWSERDRQHVCLSFRDATGHAGATIVEWVDGAVTDAVEDGFLDPRDYHGSAFAYARENGLLAPGTAPVTLSETPRGVVAALGGKGVYMGWRAGGEPIWSTEASEEELAKGAWTFDDEADARSTLENDVDDAVDDLSFAVAELDVTPAGRRSPSRASLDSCVAAGLVLPSAAPTP